MLHECKTHYQRTHSIVYKFYFQQALYFSALVTKLFNSSTKYVENLAVKLEPKLF